jgi:hypothetical protein
VLCLSDRQRQKTAVNSVSVHNVCVRTALTDSSIDKQQLEGTIKIYRNFILIYFCVVAWDLKNPTTINFLFYIFKFQSLFQSMREFFQGCCDNIKVPVKNEPRTLKVVTFISL